MRTIHRRNEPQVYFKGNAAHLALCYQTSAYDQDSPSYSTTNNLKSCETIKTELRTSKYTGNEPVVWVYGTS